LHNRSSENKWGQLPETIIVTTVGRKVIANIRVNSCKRGQQDTAISTVGQNKTEMDVIIEKKGQSSSASRIGGGQNQIKIIRQQISNLFEEKRRQSRIKHADNSKQRGKERLEKDKIEAQQDSKVEERGIAVQQNSRIVMQKGGRGQNNKTVRQKGVSQHKAKSRTER